MEFVVMKDALFNRLRLTEVLLVGIVVYAYATAFSTPDNSWINIIAVAGSLIVGKYLIKVIYTLHLAGEAVSRMVRIVGDVATELHKHDPDNFTLNALKESTIWKAPDK